MIILKCEKEKITHRHRRALSARRPAGTHPNFSYIHPMTPDQALALISTPALRLNYPTRWADLGCGTGLFTLALANFLQPASIINAVDRHTYLRQQTTPNQIAIQPLKADFEKEELGLRNLETFVGAAPTRSSSVATFAPLGCLMANSFHYIKDKPALLQRLKTSLRPSHFFLIVEYDTDKSVSTWVPYPISFSALQSLFHTAGYTTVIRLHDQPSIYNNNKLYSALIT
jgi:SAM-dependent methyltransferase